MSEQTGPPYLVSQAVAINFTAGVFTSFYFISVAYANRWLIFTDEGWKIRKNIRWHMLVVTNITLLLVLITIALTVNFSIAEAAFVEQENKLGDYQGDPWKGVVQCSLLGAIILLGDTVLASSSSGIHLATNGNLTFQMHRLWVVYMKRMTVMWFPVFLWLGGIVCMSLEIFLQVKNLQVPNFGPYKWAKIQMQVGPGIVYVPFLASTILINGYCTGLLVWRIWKSAKRAGSSSSSRQLQILIRILMESGVLYLAMSVLHFITFFGQFSYVIHVNGILHPVVIGIAYDLIIIRVGLNRTDEADMSTGALTTVRFASDDTEEKSAISVQSGEE